MNTDPISDLLTRIRNAQQAKHDTVTIPHSLMKAGILKALRDEGYIGDFRVIEKEASKKDLQVNLKYTAKKEPMIGGIVRASKPGRRIYVGCHDLKPVRSGVGLAILSTPKGILTDKQAKEAKVGGELLCRVW